jgi:hypothetical protein
MLLFSSFNVFASHKAYFPARSIQELLAKSIFQNTWNRSTESYFCNLFVYSEKRKPLTLYKVSLKPILQQKRRLHHGYVFTQCTTVLTCHETTDLFEFSLQYTSATVCMDLIAHIFRRAHIIHHTYRYQLESSPK